MDYTSVSKPSRYVGGEYGMPLMKKDAAVRFCMCFPDVYEVGMSNLGMRILYYILNREEDVVCERCFAPWKDCGDLLRSEGETLRSLDTKRPLKEFDFLGFSLQYELCYSNVLYMLDLAGIPFRHKDRSESDPIIVTGGPCVVNPAPITAFADVVFVGEGEEGMVAICKVLKKMKAEGKSKTEILKAIDEVAGCFCPPLYPDGKYKRVVMQKMYDLEHTFFPHTSLVPNLEIVHDRAVMELFRGCANGCRFCQAGFIYRPVRERSVDNVYNACRDIIRNTGYDELSLNSLSTSDYSGLMDLIGRLRGDPIFDKVNIALPSLRLNSFEGVMADSERKISLTFAPEAGTQRLRDVINKNIYEEDIFGSLAQAFREGYSTVKLYFMLGLPTETEEDVRGIADLAIRIRELFFRERTNKKDLRMNVSASVFIPKPFTPFQWEAFDRLENIRAKQTWLKETLRRKNITFSYHDWESSLIEAVFARGGEELADVIESAYRKGAMMDGWADLFNYRAYVDALAEKGLDPWKMTEARNPDDGEFWDFIDVGVTRDFLLSERNKAYESATTPSCIVRCSACGIKCRSFPQRKSQSEFGKRKSDGKDESESCTNPKESAASGVGLSSANPEPSGVGLSSVNPNESEVSAKTESEEKEGRKC